MPRTHLSTVGSREDVPTERREAAGGPKGGIGRGSEASRGENDPEALRSVDEE
jgi:hypothetical protein